jgi:ABC-type sugar transport system ATPase subunit
MNLVRREVIAGRVKLCGRELPCATSADAVLVGVRPAHVRLGHHAASDRVLTFRGIVRGSEYLGAETCVRLAVGDIELDACQPGFVRAEPGEELECHAELAQLHFFDAGSEQRLT